MLIEIAGNMGYNQAVGKGCGLFRHNLEELADLLEVIRAAAAARGYTVEELEQVRAEKAARRGGFERKLYLREVFEK